MQTFYSIKGMVYKSFMPLKKHSIPNAFFYISWICTSTTSIKKYLSIEKYNC